MAKRTKNQRRRSSLGIAAAGTTPKRSWSDVALRWAVGLAVGVGFTWLTARAWPLEELFAGSWAIESRDGAVVLAVRGGGPVVWSATIAHLAGYAVTLVAIHFVRVLRWWPLVRPFVAVPMGTLNRAGAIGFAAVFLLPLRLGELARPALLARDAGMAFGAGLSMIVVERMADGLMVTLMLFAVLSHVPAEALARSPEVKLGAWAALAVFGGAMAALIAMAAARGWTTRLLQRTLGRLSGALAQRITAMLTSFIDGLRVLGSAWAVAMFVGLTAAYWLLNGWGYWLLAQGFELPLTLTGGYAMMCTVVIGMMIPNSPGNVGSFWYFLLLPAALFGIDPGSPRAVAFALALWALQLVQVTLFGLWGMAARGRALAAQAATLER